MKPQHDFSDDVPKQVIPNTTPNNAYKVRRNWFQGVTATLETMIANGGIEGETLVHIQQLVERYTSQEFREQSLTQNDDISEANRIITLIIGEPTVFNSLSGDIKSWV